MTFLNFMTWQLESICYTLLMGQVQLPGGLPTQSYRFKGTANIFEIQRAPPNPLSTTSAATCQTKNSGDADLCELNSTNATFLNLCGLCRRSRGKERSSSCPKCSQPGDSSTQAWSSTVDSNISCRAGCQPEAARPV